MRIPPNFPIRLLMTGYDLRFFLFLFSFHISGVEVTSLMTRMNMVGSVFASLEGVF